MALCEPPEHIDGVGPDPGITAVAVGLPVEDYPSCAPPYRTAAGNLCTRDREVRETLKSSYLHRFANLRSGSAFAYDEDPRPGAELAYDGDKHVRSHLKDEA